MLGSQAAQVVPCLLEGNLLKILEGLRNFRKCDEGQTLLGPCGCICNQSFMWMLGVFAVCAD